MMQITSELFNLVAIKSNTQGLITQLHSKLKLQITLYRTLFIRELLSLGSSQYQFAKGFSSYLIDKSKSQI